MKTLKISFLGILFAINSYALGFSGYDYISQKNINLKVAHKTQVLVFLSSSCPCSNSHVAHLNQLAKDHPKVQFIGVHSNQNESLEAGKKYFSHKNLQFPVLRDVDAKLADKYGALKTPHAFIISAAGEKLYAGPVTDSSILENSKRHYLAEFLDSIKNNKKFSPVQKRPLGCYISRSKP